MNLRRNNQLLPVILIVIIVVVSVAAVVALARTLFFGQDATGNDKEVTERNELIETTADRSVRMTIRGGLTADEKFRSYQITISPAARVMTTYSGYLDQQVDSVQLENNTRAYEEFVYALNRAGMMGGTPLKGEDDDRRGLCPGGKIIEFETMQNSQSTKELWTTTCSGVKGSFKGNSGQVSDMFLAQIPQGSDLLKAINVR